MTKNKADERNESNNDEEYGEFEGAEVEDEAPEAVQAHTGHSPWVPDLLRVQSNNASNNCSSTEDDAPESLSFAQRLRSHVHFANADSTSSGVRRETGAIPKARPLAPPDVSQIGSMAAEASSSKLSSTAAADLVDLFNASLPIASARSGSSVLKSSGATSGYESNVVEDRELKYLRSENAMMKQQLLQRDNQIKHSPMSQLSSVSSTSRTHQQNSNTNEILQTLNSLTERLNRLQESIDSNTRQVMERLSNIEMRVNNMSMRSAENGSSSMCSANEHNSRSCEQHRQYFENERRQFFIAFADILRKAAESHPNSDEERRDMNGPQQ